MGMEFPPDFYLREGQQKKIEAFATAKNSLIESMAYQFYDDEVYLPPPKKTKTEEK